MGIRDAANLAWRLSLVTKGNADKSLLDYYTTERRAPCKFLIVSQSLCCPKPQASLKLFFRQDLAVQVGKIICVSSNEEADRIHAQFRADSGFEVSFKAFFSELRFRLFLDAKQVGDHPLGKPGQYTSHPAAGKLSLHRPLRMEDGSVRLLDEVMGGSRSFSGGIVAKRADRTR